MMRTAVRDVRAGPARSKDACRGKMSAIPKHVEESEFVDLSDIYARAAVSPALVALAAQAGNLTPVPPNNRPVPSSLDVWSRTLVEALFADSRDALILVDRYARVIAANSEWYLLYGEQDHRVVGQDFADVVTGKAPSEMAAVVERAIKRLEPVSEAVICRHARGFDLKLDALVTPLLDDAGDVLGFLGRLRPHRS